MEGILSNQIWTAVGVISTIILGLVAIIVTITLFILGKKKKRLAYYIVSNTQLVGIENSIQDKIKILYDEKQVTNVHLISIKFINSGNEPISVDDFDKPISIRYNSAVNILTHEIVERVPEDLDTVIGEKEKFLEITPLLLNTKDEFTVNILASDFNGDLDISARIKGVKELEIYKSYEKSSKLLVYINIFVIFLTVINVFYGREIDSYFGLDYNKILYSPLFSFFPMVLLLVLSVKSLRK
ncbi:MAG: hypothetical protein N2B60_05500 [Psychrobacter sp.]